MATENTERAWRVGGFDVKLGGNRVGSSSPRTRSRTTFETMATPGGIGANVFDEGNWYHEILEDGLAISYRVRPRATRNFPEAQPRVGATLADRARAPTPRARSPRPAPPRAPLEIDASSRARHRPPSAFAPQRRPRGPRD